jgi:gliding motility-associated-like protein
VAINAKMTMKQLLCFFLLSPLLLSAQNAGTVWYFGAAAGLDFSGGNPVQVPGGAMEAFEGCAIVSDAEGNVLFYTNGGGRDPEESGQTSGKIWNRNDEVMYDMGGTEGGGFSAMQSALILPKPGEDEVYYLFTMEEVEFNIGGSVPGQPQGRGLSYFEVDMALNNGLGGVTVVDQRVHVPAFEGLTGTIHQNGSDYWVAIVDAAPEDNRLLVFPVTNEGVTDTLSFPFDGTISGQLDISPNGQWLHCAGTVFPFDNATGQIDTANIIDLTPMPDHSRDAASFSPSSQFLYFVENTPAGRVMVQYDLESEEVEDSRSIIANLPENRLTGHMQMAVDGNLFLLERAFFPMDGTTLSILECPDTPEPLFLPDVFMLPESDNIPYTGLPNFSDHIFATQPLEFAFEQDTLTLCEDELATLSVPEFPNAAYAWSTGDTTIAIEVGLDSLYSLTISTACETVADTIAVTTIDCDTSICMVALPNTFTPNGDNTNDTFGPLSDCEEPVFLNFLLRIYNRWGNLVYETSDAALPWDGEQDGEPAPTEVYFYLMQYQVERQETLQTLQGDVTLVR